MAGLALSGLASGFDWKGIVDQLIEVSRAPQKRMQREKAELTTRTTALNEVRSSVTSLKSSVGTLATESALLKKAATIADPDSKWKTTAGTSATAGEYNFQVKQTATAGIFRGRANVGAPTASGTDPFTTPLSSLSLGATLTFPTPPPGYFMVNGHQIAVNPNSTLQSIANSIETATAGTANELLASFDSTSQRFTIYSKNASATNSQISLGTAGDTTNFLQVIGLVEKSVTGTQVMTSNVSIGSGLDSASHLVFNVTNSSDDPHTIRLAGFDIDLSPFDNINQALDKIDNGTGNVVDPSYDPLTGFFTLNSSRPINPQDINANFLASTGLLPSYNPTVVSTPILGYESNPIGKLNGNSPLGIANFSTALTGSGTVGSFFVNGVQVSYDTSADSVQNLLDRITNSAAGVTASFDSVNDSIVLTNKKTGALGVSISTINPSSGGVSLDSRGVVNALFGLNTTGDLTKANMATVVAGRDAIFNINNGGDFISNSNTLDQTVHGINGLTVDVSGDDIDPNPSIGPADQPVTQKITVRGDPSAATAAVNDFITKYNALQAVIEKHTKVTYADGKVTTGVLAGSREMADISRSLRQSLFRDANGSGTIRRLADLGVSTSGIENTISLSNAALLESQINTAGTDVLDFFTRSTSGLVPRLNALLGDSSTDVTAASGKIGIQLTSIQKQNTSLDKQIADLERRLESQRQLMESSFIAMERAQARFQQQSSYLQKTFSGNSK